MRKIKVIGLWILILIVSLSSVAMAEPKEVGVHRLDFTKEVLSIREVKGITVENKAFLDVTNPEDAAYAEAAYQNKIVSGDGGKFWPQREVTKEEAITILVRGLGVQGLVNKISEDTQKQILSFEDKDTISSWAKPYVTYALANGIIVENTTQFQPKKPLSSEEAKVWIEKAKAFYQNHLTKEGMNASEMLSKADEKLNAFDTYKYSGAMDMQTKVYGMINGASGEENVKMQLTQEGIFEKPQKSYVKSTATMLGLDKEIIQTSEVFIDNGTMYMKMPEAQKWAKLDFNPILQEMQSILGQGNTMNMGLSSEHMAMFGMYASYGANTVLDGEEYYTVDIDVDHTAFKEIYQQIIDKTINMALELNPVADQDPTNPQNNPEFIKAMIQEMLSKMEIEMSYRFYINKETKTYKDMEIEQKMKMPMGEINTEVYSKGKFNYHGFGEKVVFPEIKAEDIENLE